MLKLVGVSKKYKAKSILKNINLEIDDNAFVVLQGQSGAGKSTLLNIIGGLESPTSGQIIIDGKNINNLSSKQRNYFYRHKIGFIFQNFYLQPQLNVSDNVALAGIFAGMSKQERESRVEILASQFGITDILDHFPAEISGGQAERACVARALFMNPDIILADEPTNNLDLQNKSILLETLKDIWQTTGTTIIVASHDEMVSNYATQIIQIQDGQVSIIGAH